MNRIEDEFNENILSTSFNLLGRNGLDMEYLLTQRKELLTDWDNFTEVYLKLTPAEKMIHLGQDLLIFSMFNDEEVLSLMTRLGVGKKVKSYFIDLESMFKSVQDFIKNSKFNWNSQYIMACYYAYSLAFMLNELKDDLDINLNNFLLGVNRREEKDKLDKFEQEVLETIKSEEYLLDKNHENIEIPRHKGSLRKMFKKPMRYPDKFNYNIMYYQNFKINNMVNKRTISKYKCEFYDLVELTLRDKSILTNDEDSQLQYGEIDNCRFKKKRVEQLFLNLSDYYSK